jgi:hypothetical protein
VRAARSLCPSTGLSQNGFWWASVLVVTGYRNRLGSLLLLYLLL